MFEEMSDSTTGELQSLEESYGKWAKEMMRLGVFHGYIAKTARGKVAASGCLWLREQQPSPGRPAGLIPYLMSVYTVREYRRNGLASMIVKEAMEWARKRGYYKILLHASVKGRKVYTKLGWKRTWEMEYRFD